MSNVLIQQDTMISIANSIREKLNTNTVYKPSDMPVAIKSIKEEFATAIQTKSFGFNDNVGMLTINKL